MFDKAFKFSYFDSAKSLNSFKNWPAPFDVVITMGCGDACPWMPANYFIDWQIPDPKSMEPKQFNEVRDYIADQVKKLLKDLEHKMPSHY